MNNVSDAILPDELKLAQLACTKLTRLVHGLMSVGIAAVELPNAAGFFKGRDEPFLALVTALRYTSVKVGAQRAALAIQAQADAIGASIRTLFDLWLVLADRGSLTAEEVHR